MLSKILHSLPTTLTYRIYGSDIDRPRAWDHVMDYKSRLINVYSQAESLGKEFNEKLEEIVEGEFPSPPFGLWFLPEEKQNSENEPPSLKLIILKEPYRRLFFTDFLSLCKEFFFKIFSIYRREHPDPSIVFNTEVETYVKQMVGDINSSYYWGVPISLKAFMKKKGFIFKNFFNRFEQLVISKTGRSKKTLRNCLYSNPEYSFDVMEDKNILVFYTAIVYFYMHVDYINFKQDEPIPIIDSSDTKFFHFNEAIQTSLFSVINKHYKKYLEIDIEFEYENSLNSSGNDRFDSFIIYKEVFMQCCYKSDNNLLTVVCEEHKDIIDRIKEDYFRYFCFYYYYVENFRITRIAYTDYEAYVSIFCQ
ncbi:hypothetical protein CDIK_3081 [Cucumispora dikerogammari]|nr:hypothetical protein CDIK_3081 [Cucumispora dikerogammari]